VEELARRQEIEVRPRVREAEGRVPQGYGRMERKESEGRRACKGQRKAKEHQGQGVAQVVASRIPNFIERNRRVVTIFAIFNLAQ
jgi:hypothetical protein